MGSATLLGDPMLSYFSAEDFVIETYRDGGTGALGTSWDDFMEQRNEDGQETSQNTHFSSRHQSSRRGCSRLTEGFYYFYY